MPRERDNYFGLWLSDGELDVIERAKNALSFKDLSSSFRNILRLANIIYNDELTLKKAFKPSMYEMFLKNEEFRETVPLCDVLKSVPDLEKELGINIEKWGKNE